MTRLFARRSLPLKPFAGKAVAIGVTAVLAACATPNPTPSPSPSSRDVAAVPNDAPPTVRTVTVRDPETEERLANLQLRLLERDAQIRDLQDKLDQAMQEVVRVMAKLQSSASRAEAASAMAEAEIALEELRATLGESLEVTQAQQLLAMSSGEFTKQNYGGSLYLATQARSLARAGEGRLTGGARPSMRPGEMRFALPLQLAVEKRSNVREGPGLAFDVLFTLDPGTPLVGHSFVGEWVRVSDDQGRRGWIFHTLVGNRADRAP